MVPAPQTHQNVGFDQVQKGEPLFAAPIEANDLLIALWSTFVPVVLTGAPSAQRRYRNPQVMRSLGERVGRRSANFVCGENSHPQALSGRGLRTNWRGVQL